MHWIAIAGLAAVMATATSAQAGDVKAGENVFKKCRACHTVGPNPRNSVGPTLNGVVGRPWGAIDGYRYSAGRDGTLLAITEADPQVWDVATLGAYLHNPKDVIPKGKMSFPGLRSDADVENVITYLATIDADGNKVDPEPVLEAASGEGTEASGTAQ